MKYIFTATQDFKFSKCDNSLNIIIGVLDDQTSNLNILVWTNIINFLNDTLFYIKINSFHNNIIQDDSCTYTFIIGNTVRKNEICFYKNSELIENELFFNEQYINKLNIWIYNSDNQIYDSNGLSIQLIILFN